MGYSLIVMGVMAAISIAFAVYASTQAGNAADMDVEDKFDVTYVEDGRALALIYGKVRLPGNLIWWGDLHTKKHGGGGKGGGGGGGASSVRYYCSVWEGIGYGKLLLEKTYVNDKEEELLAAVWNNGTETHFPSYAGEWANHLPGIAHFYIKNWHIGNNVNTIPTIHFVVSRELDTPLPYQNMPNGSNPAAIIYDLLIHIGVEAVNIDISSFETASNTLFDKGYGLNIKFMSQTLKVYDAIKKVLGFFDGNLYRDATGKYVLNAFSDADPVAAAIGTEDITQFKGNRKTIQQLPNYFSAKYTNEEEDFKDRTLVIDNLANERYIGYRRDRASLDLSAYIDEESASKRLWEIMKRESYPALTVSFTTNLKYSALHAGEIIKISNEDYGITNAYFRIKSIGFNAETNNDIKITAIEQIERIQDSNYVKMGDTSWVQPDITPENLDYVDYFELPYSETYSDTPSILLLAQRKGAYVGGAALYLSVYENQGFEFKSTLTEFSVRCSVISSADESILLDIQCFDPEFDTLEWEQLFVSNRVLLLNNELIGFQDVEYISPNTYKISTLIRGLKGTSPTKTIGVGDICWVTHITENNTITNLSSGEFWFKLVPYFNNNSADITTIAATKITVTNSAKQPRAVSYINAMRSGSAIDVTIFPSTPGVDGAGDNAPNVTDLETFLYGGVLEITTSHDSYTRDENYEFTITTASATTISVVHVLNGFRSQTVDLVVGTSNGIYKG